MPGSNISGTDMAQTEGPNASLDFGKATQEKALVREGGGFATGGSPTPGGPPQGGATGPPPPGSGQQQGPQQPPLRMPGQPPVKVSDFSLQKREPPTDPWRERLRIWGAHPQAGRSLKRLAWLADPQRKPGGDQQ